VRPRARLRLLSACIVLVTLSIACAVAYAVLRGELRGQVDDQLREQAELVQRLPAPPLLDAPLRLRIPELPARVGAGAGYVQLLAPDGRVVRADRAADLVVPVTGADLAVAAGEPPALRDQRVDGVPLRTATVALPGDARVQLSRSLASVETTLGSLRWVLAALVAAGTGLAVLAGDRLGRRYGLTLAALEDAQRAQRQLVADASHELRTPVTSLRTNAELLRDHAGSLDDGARAAITADVVAQAEELGLLVGDVIELARGDAAEPERHEVALDALAAEAVARARRHAPHVRFSLEAEPVVVDAAPERLARAVNNLLDNAAQHSPAGGEVEVRVAGRELTVRDHGDGIPPEALPHVFDRFFRATTARPGSGLGLAIVKQVADQHGWEVALEPAPGGGTLARLRC
jgi:two-component system, OmpR family, sensor histidine kinase MprB